MTRSGTMDASTRSSIVVISETVTVFSSSRHDDTRKNVAAALVAASFEDTLRRLAAEKAGVSERIELQKVIGELKAAGVLVGAAISTASGYLEFRNDSLHADWKNVDRATAESCLAFVESLLNQHFS